MAVEIIIAPEAAEDIAEAYAWYEDWRVGLGEEYLSCVDACIEAIRHTPRIARFGLSELSSRLDPPIPLRGVL